MVILKILVEDESVDFLKKRKLLSQYHKAKAQILSGNLAAVSFKKRQPKKDGIYYFRINKQYRCLGYFSENSIFNVFKIDDHQ